MGTRVKKWTLYLIVHYFIVLLPHFSLACRNSDQHEVQGGDDMPCFFLFWFYLQGNTWHNMILPPHCSQPVVSSLSLEKLCLMLPWWKQTLIFYCDGSEAQESLNWHFGQLQPSFGQLWPKSVKISSNFSRQCQQTSRYKGKSSGFQGPARNIICTFN